MKIKPSTALRNEYNDISSYCKEQDQPVYITKNGEGDLVVMSIDYYTRREEQLDLREKLLEALMKKISGEKTCDLAEVDERLKGLIDGNL
ncbi:type II toxin-antitoxin system Phd/YefM family antitoxin [Sedimentibacter hydroxybenzoicus DSM 7310]|uniref:Antitoxin n=1 Tax=Sedimentibacter hydroxybenzoicus DSM 7310 TaxID=1123245 RepID=A0A974GVB4_SEDHY|nr:type II toxin-antitoxin system Phd/YefM family antitoxin [Sedimentibacter hydroxybenzoicus]NYB72925.1 type II toxin-antitoxin system Phd/YefM family antitoxin [Sedimentibacter hydroxybenzoicus DSM 7310]